MKKTYEYKGYKFEIEPSDEDDNGNAIQWQLNMVKPDFYEGHDLDGKKVTIQDMKSVICDYYDLENRLIKLTKQEVKEIKKHLTNKEQVDILGMTADEFVAENNDGLEE